MESKNNNQKKDLGEHKAQVRAIIEILGKPKEHVVATLNKLLENLKNDKNYDVEEDFIEEPIEQEDQKGVFSTYAEVLFNVKNINELISFCFEYMPSSVEIIDPEEFFVSSKYLTDLLNDMQARLHQSEMLTKQLFEENKAFNNTLNLLARNIVMISLSHKKLELSSLSRLTGISEDKLTPFLEQMIKENKIKLEDNLYSIVVSVDEKNG